MSVIMSMQPFVALSYIIDIIWRETSSLSQMLLFLNGASVANVNNAG